jgi:hypothetical protein
MADRLGEAEGFVQGDDGTVRVTEEPVGQREVIPAAGAGVMAAVAEGL